jgi:hypothetical protein
MTNFTKRVYEMLVRVLVFWATYRDLIGKDSQTDQVFQQLDATFHKMDNHARLQASGNEDVRISAEGRRAARNALAAQLEAVCRTAASLSQLNMLRRHLNTSPSRLNSSHR